MKQEVKRRAAARGQNPSELVWEALQLWLNSEKVGSRGIDGDADEIFAPILPAGAVPDPDGRGLVALPPSGNGDRSVEPPVGLDCHRLGGSLDMGADGRASTN
jgi:hypothetical protein